MITFERISAQHLKSSTDFEVMPGDRFSRVYQEGVRKMTIELEFGRTETGNPCVTLMPNAVSKWDDGTIIPKEDQLRIENNFRAAMKFADFEVVIWDHENQRYLEHTV